jgi:hypothetical protein
MALLTVWHEPRVERILQSAPQRRGRSKISGAGPDIERVGRRVPFLAPMLRTSVGAPRQARSRAAPVTVQDLGHGPPRRCLRVVAVRG